MRWQLTVLATLAWLLTNCGDDPAYQRQPPATTIDSPAALMAALERAYNSRDVLLFSPLLAHDSDRDAEYLFIPNEPTETMWGWEEETRVFHRMARPESPLPGDDPVPPELWLPIDFDLRPSSAFAEYPDLYTTHGGFLDPQMWLAFVATYTTVALFQTAGETDYQVDLGEGRFVVIEDLKKQVGDEGKFLLLIWDDICHGRAERATSIEYRCWSDIKRG